MRRAVALFLVLALGMPATAWAQGQPAQGQQTTPDTTIDASKMGVSLDRIRRQLASESSEVISSDGYKLDVRVNVFGQAPRLDFVPEGFSLTYGPVPNSAPTHQEHIAFVTPQAFKSPPIPIYGLAVWAAQKLAEKSKKSRCEAELAEYRAAVMQGISISAPRCTQ
jgi:hypothetical protein